MCDSCCREFGIKVINIKPIVKRLPVLLEDRDKSIRDETKVMTVEIYRWIGVALNPQLSSLKPVQVCRLNDVKIFIKLRLTLF